MTKQFSKNIYHLPFSKRVKPILKPAPYHEERQRLKYALDFAMPEGTPLLAAAEGTVYLVVNKYRKGGPDKSLAPRCNKIIIKHDNEEYTNYVHLKKGSKVKKGDYVKKGQMIGYSGLTGYATYPHLHFAVMKLTIAGLWKTVIPKFKIDNKIVTLESPRGG